MRKIPVWLGVGAALLAVVLFGQVSADSESYEPLQSAPAAYRALLTGTDSVDWSAPIDISGGDASVRLIGRNPTLGVSVRCTVAEAQVAVACGLWQKTGSTYSFLGIAAVLTATAHWDNVDSSSRYIAPQLYFDTGSGATHYELRIDAPSSGSVQLVPVLYGIDPRSP